MGQTADQLRDEIDSKRDDAAAKIDEIEARVQNTAQMARDTVDDTMQSAKEMVNETVTETMETVTETVETVKQSFDLNKQVQERPLMMLGAAALGGFILGGMVGGGGDKRRRADYRGDIRSERFQSSHSGSGPLQQVQQAVRQSGLDNTMSAITGALVGLATDRVRGIVDESFPEFGQRLRQEMDTASSRSRSEPRYNPSSYTAGSYAEGAQIPPQPEGVYREPLR
jgi:ElaB/YqjD/DUF883 family membrane-anchored ribosome-binding protein